MSITGAETIRWDLWELYTSPEDPKLQATLASSENRSRAFEAAYKGRVKDLGSQELRRAFQELEELLAGLYKAEQFASLLFAVDTGNDKLKAFEAKVNERLAKIGNQLVFFDLELGQLSQEQAQTYADNPRLSELAYYLKRKVETARYDLSEKEERLNNLKDLTGSQAFYTLYEQLVSSFRFDFEVDGEKKVLNGDELRALRQHADPRVRREAMHLFLSRYAEHQLVIGNCFNAIVKSYALEGELRGYATPISRRNVGNDLSDESVRVLHEATVSSYPLVQRYYELKKKLMAMPDMTLADIYAPLPQADKRYTWEEAKALVLTAFQGFDEDFHSKALRMFERRRIDAPVEPSKRGGAFCSSSIPGLDPYVLLNFTGRLRDVATLAHELGHAIHAMVSQGQNLFNYHAILPLAETASIFSEMVLTDYLLKTEQDPKVRLSLLTNKLEDIFASSHRQNMFSQFELQAHGAISRELMSPEGLCDLYAAELQRMFGQSVAIPDEYRWEWSAIPHLFAYPFYVYAYNFANLLVLALYQQYREQGPGFVPSFRRLLSLGSSTNPASITAVVGADIHQRAFWEKSLKVIEGYIEELEKLI